MPNRILFLVSAVLASLTLSSLALPLIPNAALAADDCLTSPDTATTTPGGHWRYHIERGTGRKCWYLANDAAKGDAAKADTATPTQDDADTTASIPPRPAAKIAPSLERAAASPPDRPRITKPAPPPAAPVPTNNARAEFVDQLTNTQAAPPVPAQSGPPQAASPDA